MPSSAHPFTFILVLASLLHRWPCGCVSPAEGGDVIASCPDCAEGTCPSCGDFGNCRCSCECPGASLTPAALLMTPRWILDRKPIRARELTPSVGRR